MKTQCEIREGIGLCDSCLLPKWPQEYVGNGDMVCKDCLDKFYGKAVKTIRRKLKGKSTVKTQSYRRVGTSKKRANELARYRRMRKSFLSRNRECWRCGYDSEEVHHFYGKTGALLTFEIGFRAVCRNCHTDIETHRKEASRLGYRAPENLFGYPSRVFKLYGP